MIICYQPMAMIILSIYGNDDKLSIYGSLLIISDGFKVHSLRRLGKYLGSRTKTRQEVEGPRTETRQGL